MKHPYAELLIAIAEGKEIQYQHGSTTWHNIKHNRLLKHLAYDEQDKPAYMFRVKPATININGVECEAPVEDGKYDITICGGEYWFATIEARDAAYAALIKPFGEHT